MTQDMMTLRALLEKSSDAMISLVRDLEPGLQQTPIP